MRESILRMVTWACTGCCLVLAAEPLSAQVTQERDPQIAQTISDWQKRQERTKRVRYEASGQQSILKGSFRGPGLAELPEPQPSRDITSPIRQVVLVDLSGGRYRIEEEMQKYDQGTDRLYPQMQTRIYDGNEIKSWRPRQMNTHPLTGVKPNKPEIGVGRGDLSSAAFTMVEWPFFVGHGVIASQNRPIMPGKWRTYPDPDLMIVHGRSVHSGRACLVIRTQTLKALGTSFDEYWVDTQRESAVVRQVCYANQIALYEMAIDYQSTPHGWLPKSWTITQRDAIDGKTTYYRNVNCTKIDLEPESEPKDFQIEERPGMLVSEHNHFSPKLRDRQAPDVETKLFQIDDEGKRHLIPQHFADQNRRYYLYYYYFSACILATLFGLAVWWRHRRLRRA